MRAKDLQMKGLDVGSTYVLILCPNCCEAFLVYEDLHVKRCPYCEINIEKYAMTLGDAMGLVEEEGETFP